jgi:hypothetical protein
VIRASGDPGVITITAKAKSLGETNITINAQSAQVVR